MLQFIFTIFIFSVLPLKTTQNIPSDWRSSTTLSSPGHLFTPLDYSALFLSEFYLPSLLTCTRHCHSTRKCRIFDYDPQSTRCRLFEGELTSMGQLTPSPSSPLARVGSLRITSHQFINLGQPCSMCLASRYMRCSLNACQCPASTFYDGSICRSQRLLGQPCQNASECRTDLNYTCLSNLRCGVVPSPMMTVVGGYGEGSSGTALNALDVPLAISVTVNNTIYVADSNNHRVLKLEEGSLTGQIVAGTGVSGTANNRLNYPTGLHVDNESNIYVTDSSNFRIMLWLRGASTGIRVAGTGFAGNTLSTFYGAGAVYVDLQGNLYLADYVNHRIMRWAPNATNAVIVAGTGTAGNGNFQLNSPYGFAVDELNSYLYVADYNNHRIQRFQMNVSTQGVTVAGGNGPGTGSHQLYAPISICFSRLTNAMYIADSANGRIQRWMVGATNGTTIVGPGSVIANYSAPLAVGAIDLRLSVNEDYLYVSESPRHRILRFRLL